MALQDLVDVDKMKAKYIFNRGDYRVPHNYLNWAFEFQPKYCFEKFSG